MTIPSFFNPNLPDPRDDELFPFDDQYLPQSDEEEIQQMDAWGEDHPDAFDDDFE